MKNLYCYSTVASVRFVLFPLCIFFIVNWTDAQPKLIFSPLIQNLSKPVEVKNAGDGSKRLFIVEQTGAIKIYKNGSLLSNPFLNLSSVVKSDTFGGLWSIAFPDNYQSSRYFFVYYVDKNNATTLARYRTSIANADSALPNSGVTLLSLSGENSGGPKMGQLHFGKD